MKSTEYLQQVLRDQTFTANSEELKKLREHREKVEKLLRQEFKEGKATIRYGGSMAKSTMIKEKYDLDVICYFPHEEDDAGETLEEIYENVAKALGKEYFIERKNSAIRLKSPGGTMDFHVDTVPGRFVDGDDGDVFIYQATAEKCRLKTNLNKQIDHIKESGVIDAIRLIKLWAVTNRLDVKTFVLELLVIDLLKSKKSKALDEQLIHVWTEFSEHSADLSVKDPANPEGNDLSSYLDSVRILLSSNAASSLRQVESGNWEGVFGKVDAEEEARAAGLRKISAGISSPARPWYDE